MKNLLILLFFPFVLLGQNNSFIDLLKKHFENPKQQFTLRNDTLFIQLYEPATATQAEFKETSIIPMNSIDRIQLVTGKDFKGVAGISLQIHPINFTKLPKNAEKNTITSERLSQVNVASVNQKIQGQVSGVTVGNDNSPGGGTMVRIRGIGSINANSPLYVIDDVPYTGNINAINPNDIESVTVLKDPSQTAIYGVRGANGVIVMKTKKGTNVSAVLDVEDQEIPVILWTWGEAYKQLKKSGDLSTLKTILSSKTYDKN
ncbi:MAG: TonB-dependent receptor plug domain-containing protein [Cytophagales bacterium]|nr:TonB-dependent receptor plug domain-containing protein [Cytophagales bacterium]